VPEGVQTLAWRRSLLNACRDAAQALFGEKPLIDAVEYIALRFKEATGLRWMVIGLADLEQGTLEFPAGQVAALGLPAVWKMGETLSGQAILSNRPVIHFDGPARQHLRVPDSLRRRVRGLSGHWQRTHSYP
jgi:hypothetical protein